MTLFLVKLDSRIAPVELQENGNKELLGAFCFLVSLCFQYQSGILLAKSSSISGILFGDFKCYEDGSTSLTCHLIGKVAELHLRYQTAP
ncbi:hypothetical protein PanWU01x14_029150 [Parasponia andersonii]|uniref:Uncharacterized protein n=1 Tax=Parasponia andersonii TaxID=3476 RepID=A0A2P5DVH6_PARAD|nr:hypothetical protein PanWU01x14_029150 [Parasponia andersonii]